MPKQKTEEELQKELASHSGLSGSSLYTIRDCKCGVRYVAATTARGCRACCNKIDAEGRVEQRRRREVRLVGATIKTGKCYFCSGSDNLEIHHIDKDRRNNTPSNSALLCRKCHRKLHHKMYNPLLKRFFTILTKERFAYETIGEMFGTTKQNVYNILNRGQELSTD